jgi:hypothetical protein
LTDELPSIGLALIGQFSDRSMATSGSAQKQTKPAIFATFLIHSIKRNKSIAERAGE